MSDSNVADLPVEQEQAAPTLDDLITNAMAEPEAPPAEGDSKSAEPPLKVDATGRVHGEKGRFAPKDKAAKPDQSTAPEASADGATESANNVAPTATAEPATTQQPEPHARWDDTRKARFSTLPPEAKQFALDVQAEHEANFTRKAQEHSDYRRAADPLLQAVQPYKPYLEQVSSQVGMPPATLISELLKTEHALRTGTPEQKVQALGSIIHSYGINLASLIGGQGQPQGALDPTILNLRQQIAQLDHRNRTIETRFEQQHREAVEAKAREQDAQIHSTIEAFSTAKTEDGQPRYPHYERVRGVMSQLLAEQKASTLEQAYDQAIAPINEAVAKELAKRSEAAETERKTAIERAKKAAPVRATGSQPNGAASKASLDAILGDAMAKHGM